VGVAGLATIVAGTAAIATAAAARPSFLVPASAGGWPAWLAGPLPAGPALDATGYGWLMLAMFAGYVAVLWAGPLLSARAVVGAIVAAHLLLLLAPPLLSGDVMGYISYARLGLHGIDPYVHGAAAAPADAIRPYVLWHDVASPYGPLFTVASYALVPLGIGGGLWAIKVAVVASSLGAIALVWRTAERLGRVPVTAAVLVGLNPVLLVFAVGGAHNDLLVVALETAAIAFVVAGRERAGAAAVVAGAAVKASAILLLPYMVASAAPTARRRLLTGALAATLAASVVALAAFGGHAADFARQLLRQQDIASTHSVPSMVSRASEAPAAASGAVRIVCAVALAAAVLVTLVRTLRGGDWISGAGWATLALLVTTSWLLPWYVVWLLPLAALAAERRLALATLGFTAYLLATRVPFVWAGAT
jgi:alpha-1,6-mannosyltransferase